MSGANLVRPDEFSFAPRVGMVLAAGLGTRMRPLTETRPKPLIKVHGRTLIDHALDALVRSGVERAIVNVHYLADQIEEHLSKRHDLEILISDERNELLDSGGGIANALSLIGQDPFYLLNADSFWIEGFKPNLQRLAEQWDPHAMDMLLLVSSMANAVGFGTLGDFDMDADGRLTRRLEHTVAAFAYAGAAIVDPAVFAHETEKTFSLNKQFDESLEKEKLFGVRLEGLWLHVGTPEAIQEAEDAIARSAA